jgi:hypothetical protein
MTQLRGKRSPARAFTAKVTGGIQGAPSYTVQCSLEQWDCRRTEVGRMVKMEGACEKRGGGGEVANFWIHSWRDYIIRKKIKVTLPSGLKVPLSRRIGRVEVQLHLTVHEDDLSVSRFGPSVPWRTRCVNGSLLTSCCRRKSLALLQFSRQ